MNAADESGDGAVVGQGSKPANRGLVVDVAGFAALVFADEVFYERQLLRGKEGGERLRVRCAGVLHGAGLGGIGEFADALDSEQFDLAAGRGFRRGPAQQRGDGQ